MKQQPTYNATSYNEVNIRRQVKYASLHLLKMYYELAGRNQLRWPDESGNRIFMKHFRFNPELAFLF